jgi:hypothetical protein
MIPMTMDGPIVAAKNVAEGLGWAHFSCLEMLLMGLAGPILAAYQSCQCPWMGPF